MTAKNEQKYNITKEDLNKLYLIDGLSTNKIAELYGMKSHKTVSSYLKKYNIPLRSKSEALMVHHNGTEPQRSLTNHEIEIIIGELLGDGNLTIDHRNIEFNGLPYYRHSSKYEKYLKWLSSCIPCLKWNETSIINHKYEKKDGSQLISYRLRSQCHPDLLNIYKSFYIIENGEQKKIVPKDLILTPTMIRQWFIGDGSAGFFSTGTKKGKQNKAWQVYFSTFCFSEKEIEHLINQLSLYGIKSVKNRKKKGICIRISSESFDLFYDVIGKCPVDCYSYKWREHNEEYQQYLKRIK
jgi:hypothetical protein